MTAFLVAVNKLTPNHIQYRSINVIKQLPVYANPTTEVTFLFLFYSNFRNDRQK